MSDANAANTPARPLEIFYAYSHKDESLRDELETHLSILKRAGVISCWHDRRIPAGKEWGDEIGRYLNSADIILLLVSSDFIASDYCYNKEMARAMERHDQGEARVIPVIVRDCDWNWGFIPFSKLQALPKDGKPVDTWSSRDGAFKDIAMGIRRVAEELRGTPSKRLTSDSPKHGSVQVGSTPKAKPEIPTVETSSASAHSQTFQRTDSLPTSRVAARPGLRQRVAIYHSPKHDQRDLCVHGPRLEIEIGPPILRTSKGTLSPRANPSSGTFWRMPALIDTGASRTVLTPEAVARVGLPQVEVIQLARADGISENAGVHVAAIQFPRHRLGTIEIAKVICCELPKQPIQCLIGRDILSRWLFTYDGRAGAWKIEEDDVAAMGVSS